MAFPGGREGGVGGAFFFVVCVFDRFRRELDTKYEQDEPKNEKQSKTHKKRKPHSLPLPAGKTNLQLKKHPTYTAAGCFFTSRLLFRGGSGWGCFFVRFFDCF